VCVRWRFYQDVTDRLMLSLMADLRAVMERVPFVTLMCDAATLKHVAAKPAHSLLVMARYVAAFRAVPRHALPSQGFK
jgi:hypothetical protein